MWYKGSSWASLGQDSKVEIEKDKVHRHGDTKQVEGPKQCVYEELSLQWYGLPKKRWSWISMQNNPKTTKK